MLQLPFIFQSNKDKAIENRKASGRQDITPVSRVHLTQLFPSFVFFSSIVSFNSRGHIL